MNYILSFIMLLALNTALFATGTRTIKFTYTHKIKFTDPSNNINDPLGRNNPTLAPNGAVSLGAGEVYGGAPCVPGIKNCVGGSNSNVPGSIDSIYYDANGNAQTTPSVNQYTRVTMGKYYNPDIMSKVDNNFSTLTDITFELKSGANTVWSHTFTLAGISTDASNPTIFDQYDGLSSNTWLGRGSIYRDANGSIIFTTAPLITNALENASSLVLTATPTVTGDGLPNPVSQTFNVASLCAQGEKIGVTKYAQTSADHEGWYLMDGRLNSSITNLNAKAAAQLLFPNAMTGGNLPNMDGLYTVATITTNQAYNAAGVVNNQITVQNTNIHSATILSTENGGHSHSVYAPQYYGWVGYNGTGTITGSGYSFDNSWNEPGLTFATDSPGSTSTNGDHRHNTTIGVGSPTPISIQPRSAKLYQFVYLGQ